MSSAPSKPLPATAAACLSTTAKPAAKAAVPKPAAAQPPPKKKHVDEDEEEEEEDDDPEEEESDDPDMEKEDTDEDEEEEDDAKKVDLVDEQFEQPPVARIFEVLQPCHIVETRVDVIQRVTNVLAVPPSTASLLLQHFNWDENRLCEKFFSGVDIWEECKVANPSALPKPHENPEEEVDCPICCCPYPVKEMTGLPCGHLFCQACWQGHLKQKILNENQSKLIECPSEGCKLLVDQMTVSRLLRGVEEVAYERYTRLIAEAFVEDSRDLRWCPAPGCKNAVRMFDPAPKAVTCLCKHSFCFMCGDSPHEPASCDMMKQWAKKLADDSETANFMAVFTKECPKCKVVIYKDEGCQYMRCPRCHHAFCWLCLGSFDHVDHKCNRYQAEAGDSARAELHKFSHFFDRFSNHKRSKELELKLVAQAPNRMAELLRERGGVQSHHEYVMEAAKQLQEARAMLMNTYIYGFFLPPEVHRDLFEFLQADLEQAVERLSQVLEDKARAWADRDRTIALLRNVQHRITNMIDGLEAGDIRGTGPQQEKLYYDPTKSAYQGWVYGKNLAEDDEDFKKQKAADEARKARLAAQMAQIAKK
ncbi:putative E3 ubiquitin-protein ligase arih1 [Paratrimastix pyriformis]|uniref:RBR-type E3 ubiquitin transferase n=1 Tax=Paratrimastix pyriformis TaxID=342808 RepID=A0ABQ8V0M3_9EUKA|nr:putative E3 ubiquitin-protein ligase arih1 [Paratrimastix pyriformis]